MDNYLALIPSELLSFETIGLPKICSALCRRPRGLFLVTGPTGSGKTLAAFLVGFVGFFVIFVAPVVGTLIGRVTFWAVRRRRGRFLPYLVAGTVVLGTAVAWLFGAGSFLWLGIYAFMAASAAYYFVKV